MDDCRPPDKRCHLANKNQTPTKVLLPMMRMWSHTIHQNLHPEVVAKKMKTQMYTNGVKELAIASFNCMTGKYFSLLTIKLEFSDKDGFMITE